MILDNDKPKPQKEDKEAPEMLEIIIKNHETSEIMLNEISSQKHFSTGSVGYYLGTKMTNPKSGERYQISCSIALIGSKPKI